MKKHQTAIGKSESVNVLPPSIPEFTSVSTTVQMNIAVFPYDADASATRVENLLDGAKSGKPLHRSKSLDELAAKACKLRGQKPHSAKTWASTLARSLTSQND